MVHLCLVTPLEKLRLLRMGANHAASTIVFA